MKVEADTEFIDFLRSVVESSDSLSLQEMNMAVEAMNAYMKYETLKRRLQRG